MEHVCENSSAKKEIYSITVLMDTKVTSKKSLIQQSKYSHTCILLSSSLSNTSATGVDSMNCTKPAKNGTMLKSDWIFTIQ